jgi:adenine deaminase
LTPFPDGSLKVRFPLKTGRSFVEEKEHDKEQYILPGMVDTHVHIESSMTLPSIFARMAVAKGTVAVVSDLHEIANVMGEEGIDYMLEDSKRSPLKVFSGRVLNVFFSGACSRYTFLSIKLLFLKL